MRNEAKKLELEAKVITTAQEVTNLRHHIMTIEVQIKKVL
jgi:hypothetical protein